MIPNVLAERYASEPIKSIWSAEGKVLIERDFWIAVMKAQRELGLDIPAEAIAAYERVRDTVDLDSIQERERRTLHDVKARIEAFCDLAGHQHIHKGLTSRDLTENVEQLQVYRSLQLIRVKAAAALKRFADQARRHRDLVITGRTHNVAAQPTTFGKRLAMSGQEVLTAFRGLEAFIDRYPARGLKGAVGTQLDLMTLFQGEEGKVAELEGKILGYLGIRHCLNNTGQVYPRSIDFETVSRLCQLSAGAGSFARTLRLMAGHELASEGFVEGQVGSSAMPHKMNSRSCERINGFHTLLQGYVTMTAALAGDQWNEGDVSCSVVRRVALPDAFFAADGMLETLLTVLGNLEPYPAVIEEENRRYLPFLATTTILMEAVRAGAGREEAHEAIKEHALAAVRALRSGETRENDLADRLAADPRVPLGTEELREIFARRRAFLGAAPAQVDRFIAETEEVLCRHPEAADYEPGKIL